jgi:hypothetical protein
VLSDPEGFAAEKVVSVVAYGVGGQVCHHEEVPIGSIAGVGRVTAPRSQHPDGMLLISAALTAAIGLMWVGGACSAWLSGHGEPRGRLLDGFLALAHAWDPSRAWGAPVGGPVLYWSTTAVLLLGVLSLVFVARRLWKEVAAGPRDNPTRQEGLAERSAVRKAVGARVLLTRASRLRPKLQMWAFGWGEAGEWIVGRRSRIRCCCWGRPGPERARAS